uniref:Neur_chan_LBD domain-containing protein n=1 Tax=Panagrellus redivivus TaxID=6233 RepID=A0A7E4W1S3_PANRE
MTPFSEPNRTANRFGPVRFGWFGPNHGQSLLPDARDQVYITDNHIVCRWAMKETIMFRIRRYLHQFDYTRKVNDGYHTIMPAWKSVLMVDEIMEKGKKIYVDDTLILHCQIANYEKMIPYIFGPYTRLVLHGNITWKQAKLLIHPGVVQVRINAKIHLQHTEYADFVEFATRHIRGIWYNFSFYNNAYYNRNLFTRLNAACRNLQDVVITNSSYDSNTFHVTNKYRYVYVIKYAFPLFIAHCGLWILMIFVLMLLSGDATALYYNQPNPPENAFTTICSSLLLFYFFLHCGILMCADFLIRPMDIISDRILENSTPDGCLTTAKSYISNGIYWVVSTCQKLNQLT